MNTEDFRPEKKAKIFYPPQRVLMGPGPSDTHPRVLNAMARPTLGHLDPVFTEMMEEIKGLMRYAFQTQNRMTFPVSGATNMYCCTQSSNSLFNSSKDDWNFCR